jgi:hypothetical protein
MFLSPTVFALGVLAALAGSTTGALAQDVPPIPGLTNTAAVEGTVEKTYAGANTIAVKTVDGIEHLFHFTKRTVVHGTDATDEAFSGLKKGSRVVVHYTADGADKTAAEVDRIGDGGLHEMRGVVTDLDRGAKRLSIRLADGTRETLQLSDRTARDGDKGVKTGSTVVTYYTYDDGTRVTHYMTTIHGG